MQLLREVRRSLDPPPKRGTFHSQPASLRVFPKPSASFPGCPENTKVKRLVRALGLRAVISPQPPPGEEGQQPSALRVRLGIAAEIVRGLRREPRAITTLGWVGHRESDTWSRGEPWWNRRAIRYLSDRATPGSRVFEWGAGGSTIWLHERDLTVTSIENKRKWAQRVLERCPNADVRHIPGTTTGGKGFWDDYVDAIDRFENEFFDIVIIDGMCREECAARAVPKVKPGGMIVVDDTDQPWYPSVPEQLPGWHRDRVVGFKRSTKPLTETSFFYKPSAT